MLDAEIKYYDEHFDELVQKHNGRIGLIKGQLLIGTFDTRAEAMEAGVMKFGMVPFLVRRIGERGQKFFIPAYSLGILQDGNISSTISHPNTKQ